MDLSELNPPPGLEDHAPEVKLDDLEAVSEPTEKKLPTPAEWRKLRGQFFTERRQTIAACGHKFYPENPPQHANCDDCWFAFFQTHGELTQSIEEAYQKLGLGLVERLQGRKVAREFLKFMGMLAALQRENERNIESVSNGSGAGTIETATDTRVEDDGRALESNLGGGEVAVQGIQDGGDVSQTGE